MTAADPAALAARLDDLVERLDRMERHTAERERRESERLWTALEWAPRAPRDVVDRDSPRMLPALLILGLLVLLVVQALDARSNGGGPR